MRSLEDALFLFTMRQVVVLTSWLVVPPAFTAEVGGLDWPAFLRHWLDAKAAVLLYTTTSLGWYGLSIGLYQRPLDRVGFVVVTAAAKAALYVGVAVLRVYPLLNSRGVTLLQAVLALVFRFPVATLALGAAAVEPAGEEGGRGAGNERPQCTLFSFCAFRQRRSAAPSATASARARSSPSSLST